MLARRGSNSGRCRGAAGPNRDGGACAERARDRRRDDCCLARGVPSSRPRRFHRVVSCLSRPATSSSRRHSRGSRRRRHGSCTAPCCWLRLPLEAGSSTGCAPGARRFSRVRRPPRRLPSSRSRICWRSSFRRAWQRQRCSRSSRRRGRARSRRSWSRRTARSRSVTRTCQAGRRRSSAGTLAVAIALVAAAFMMDPGRRSRWASRDGRAARDRPRLEGGSCGPRRRGTVDDSALSSGHPRIGRPRSRPRVLVARNRPRWSR